MSAGTPLLLRPIFDTTDARGFADQSFGTIGVMRTFAPIKSAGDRDDTVSRFGENAGHDRCDMQRVPQRILVVDDEPEVRSVLAAVLSEGARRTCATAATADEAIRRLGRDAFDVVMTDICMPGTDGMALMDDILRQDPHPSVILMTGRRSAGMAEQARRRGAFELVCKPFDLAELRGLVDRAAAAGRTASEPGRDGELVAAAQRTVWKFIPDPPDGQPERRAVTDADVQRQLKRLYIESVRALVAAVEAKDPYTEKHSVVVSYYCKQLARRLGMSREQVDTVQTAAILHDIGKIGVPDAILQKPGPLTPAEFAIVRTHPERAEPILGHASFLSNELPIILHHHERYDGQGYPHGLRGTEIPVLARVLSIADAIDTILSARAYKPPCDLSHVKRELLRGAGSQFDPAFAAAAVAWLTECPGDIVVQPVEVCMV